MMQKMLLNSFASALTWPIFIPALFLSSLYSLSSPVYRGLHPSDHLYNNFPEPVGLELTLQCVVDETSRQSSFMEFTQLSNDVQCCLWTSFLLCISNGAWDQYPNVLLLC